jgi:hypothetical protein
MSDDMQEVSRDEIAKNVDKAADRAEQSSAHLHDVIAAAIRDSAENIRAGKPPLAPPDQ